MGSNETAAAAKFGPISEWDVSQVSTMASMFMNAQAFNGDLSLWDMSQVTTMVNMFSGAKAFNGDIGR